MRAAFILALTFAATTGANAAEPSTPTWSDSAWDTWIRMGVGMHVMLGKVGIGDMAGQPAPPQRSAPAPKAVITRPVLTERDHVGIQHAVITTRPAPPVAPPLPASSDAMGAGPTFLGLNTMDFALSAASTGTLIGIAGYGCGTLGASLGPLTAAAAFAGCSWLGKYVAGQGMRVAYDRMGMPLDERALWWGQLAGGTFGGWEASHQLAIAAVPDPTAAVAPSAHHWWNGVGPLAHSAYGHVASRMLIEQMDDWWRPAAGTSGNPGTWWEVAFEAGRSAARAADSVYAYAWYGKEAAAPYASQALDAATPYAGAAWDATRKVAQAGYGIAADGVSAGMDNLPAVAAWSADFAAAGATAFVSVGGATFACGVVATPFAALSGGAAYLACTPVAALGGFAGLQALRRTYDHFGRVPDESAFAIGSIAGGLAGGVVGQDAVTSYARWSLQSRYDGFTSYSKEARALTRSNIRAWGDEVALKRAGGFQVDHVMSLKCGWTHGVSVAVIAGLQNLQYLPARQNMSLGAKGC